MSLYVKPREFGQIASCTFVSKHPVISLAQVPSSPILFLHPVPRLRRVGSLDVPVFPKEHPGIKLAEDLRCDSDTEVVGPSSDNGIESSNESRGIRAEAFLPFCPQFLPYRFYRFLAWFDQQFVARLTCLGSFVVADVKTQEVKPFCQVNNLGLFL